MITMNRMLNERFTSKASGSQEPRWTKAHNPPATPIKNELTAKADSLAYIGRMPMISAATSMSLVAIHARPIRPRTRFLATAANSTRIDRHSRYFLTGVSKVSSNSVTGGAVMDPDEELLVNHATRLNIQSTKNCAARVATAR